MYEDDEDNFFALQYAYNSDKLRLIADYCRVEPKEIREGRDGFYSTRYHSYIVLDAEEAEEAAEDREYFKTLLKYDGQVDDMEINGTTYYIYQLS